MIAVGVVIKDVNAALIGTGLLAFFLITVLFILPSRRKHSMDISQIINELGEDRENYFNAVAPPIMQTSNFAFKKVADLSKAFEE